MMGMTAIAIRDGTLCALHVNRVTDYEGIDRQQKSERARPLRNVGPASVAAAGAMPGVVAAGVMVRPRRQRWSDPGL